MTTRVARLTCVGCAREQRVVVHVGDGGEFYPWCPTCGPTTWLAFPKLECPVVSRVDYEGRESAQSQIERIFGKRWW